MNEQPITQRQSFLLGVAWWSFWAFAQTMVLHRIGLSWNIALIESAITTALFGLVGFVISNTLRYYRPLLSRSYLIIGYAIVLLAIVARSLYWIFHQMHLGDDYYENVILKFMPLRALFYFLMILMLISFHWYRNKLNEMGNMKRREEEATSLMREAELAKLRQQLQPHFLFNSLNSISALAGNRPEEARKMIQQLSDFLRGTLKKDEQQLITFKEELGHLQLYLEIEKVRFGHRLSTEIQYDDIALQMKLPSLLLQPIVENAVKFGLYDTIDNVVIRIKAYALNDMLMIEIENPFDSATAKPIQGTGFGLTSVQRRLHLLYARQDLLEAFAKENNFITKLSIPQAS